MASQSSGDHIGNFRPLAPSYGNATYAAARSLKPQVRFSRDLREVTCKGILLDNIAGLGGLKMKCRNHDYSEDHSEEEYSYVPSTSPTNCSREIEEKSTLTLTLVSWV